MLCSRCDPSTKRSELRMKECFVLIVFTLTIRHPFQQSHRLKSFFLAYTKGFYIKLDGCHSAKDRAKKIVSHHGLCSLPGVYLLLNFQSLLLNAAEPVVFASRQL